MATALTKSAPGPPTRHLLGSQGSSIYPFNFYSTTYSVQHGRHPTYPHPKFRHKGTGYIANFRPTVYYNKQVDQTENPTVAKLLEDVYGSLTSRDYNSTKQKSGCEQLPKSIRQSSSGFTRNPQMTRAHHRASSDTTYREGYPLKKFRNDNVNPSSHSNKEGSGFIHANNIEPITFRPTECHAGDLPGEITWRPTGQSMMKQDYSRTSPITGCEPLSLLSTRASQSNGFIKGNRCPATAQPIDIKGPTLGQLHPQVVKTKQKCDPAVFSTVTHPHRYTAYTKVTYTPQGIHPCNKKDNGIGKKELSGFCENTASLFPSTDSVQQHTTLCQESYRNPLTHDTQPTEPIRKILANGFTKSTRVHSYGPQLNNVAILRNQHPYVAKCILAKDPCFVDYTYRNKQRSTL